MEVATDLIIPAFSLFRCCNLASSFTPGHSESEPDAITLVKMGLVR